MMKTASCLLVLVLVAVSLIEASVLRNEESAAAGPAIPPNFNSELQRLAALAADPSTNPELRLALQSFLDRILGTFYSALNFVGGMFGR